MPCTTVFRFDETAAVANWRSVDDVVMGGVSDSDFVPTEGGAAFTGTVSLEHGGGFASIRAPETRRDWSAYDGLVLRLRGDGKRYWLTTYTDPGGSISYRACVEPPSTWTTFAVPFEALRPYRRGTEQSGAPPFDPSEVRTLGFLIADGQDGPFRLEVAWIGASSEAAIPEEAVVVPPE